MAQDCKSRMVRAEGDQERPDKTSIEESRTGTKGNFSSCANQCISATPRLGIPHPSSVCFPESRGTGSSQNKGVQVGDSSLRHGITRAWQNCRRRNHHSKSPFRERDIYISGSIPTAESEE